MEIRKRTEPLRSEDCDSCKGKGGVYDCGWWYECYTCHPEAYEHKDKQKETND